MAATPGASGEYGTLGVGSGSNYPGAREGAVSWTDSSGNLWLFGGTPNWNNGFNDLWKLTLNGVPTLAATPTFSPAAGTYAAAQSVTISDTTPGAVIYYTTDGTQPTTSSSVYSAPIPVSSTETFSAMATATGFSNSPVATALYTITPSVTLTSIAIAPLSETILAGQTVQFTATGTYSDNSTQNLTSSVTWNNSNPNGCTMSTAGLATCYGIGATTFTASLGGVSSNSVTLP